MTALIHCRNCRHWQHSHSLETILSYPAEQTPDSGWLDGVCVRLRDGIHISCSGGWDGCTVDSVETDANFGCVYGEVLK
jgi:hypothetical protein